jgi:hypothetical protein
LLFPREPQEPRGCGVDEAEEVRPDIEHLGEGAQIGRSHADAKRMQGDGPELSRKPMVASHLGGVSQGRCAGVDALAQLQGLGAVATLDRFPGLGHGIDRRVIDAIVRRLGGAVPASI